MDRCEEDWCASDNNLRGTRRGNRRKPNVGRQPTGRLSTAVLCCGLEKNGIVRAWHRHGMASVNQTRPHSVNQMGKTHSKPLAARHGRGTAWTRYVHGMLCVNRPLKDHSEAPAYTLIYVYDINMDWDSVVGNAIRYGLDGSGIESQWRRDFPLTFTPDLGPTQPPVQWGTGSLSRGTTAGPWRCLFPPPF